MFAALALPLLALSSAGRAGGDDPDLVVLADGKEIECRVLYEGDDKVVYRAKRKTREVERSEVKDVQSVERSLRQFVDRFASVDPSNVGALTDLAVFAEQSYLPGEAHNTWIRILTLDPENERAWTQLGGVKRRKGWELKVRGRYYDIEELRTRVADWKNALELRTAHFLIKTDGQPERALDLSIDVERAFLAYYDVLQAPLTLYVFDEIPEIHVYADPKDYPSPPTPGQAAWFQRSSNTLYVNGSQGSDRGQIVAEFVDALVYNSFRRTLDKKTGELEPWVREGLRQAFAAAVRPDPGRVRFEFGTPVPAYFRMQASDDDALSLKQVLRAGRTSFDSGTDARRYVAQSYTLTYFLVYAQDGKYRRGFADFLRSSYLGRGGASNFFKALGVAEKELEAEWHAYVAQNG